MSTRTRKRPAKVAEATRKNIRRRTAAKRVAPVAAVAAAAETVKVVDKALPDDGNIAHCFTSGSSTLPGLSDALLRWLPKQFRGQDWTVGHCIPWMRGRSYVFSLVTASADESGDDLENLKKALRALFSRCEELGVDAVAFSRATFELELDDIVAVIREVQDEQEGECARVTLYS